MNESDIVVSGMGVATSIGCSVKQFSESLSHGDTRYSQHKQIKESDSSSHLVAYVDDYALGHGINMRKARKLDRFCLLSLQAFEETYKQSKLDQETSYEFGILLGNSTGGWSYVEPQLSEIYSGNFNELSPYVATAWFPTAPQGEISIQYKIAGYSKTFSADSLSVGYALDHALYLLENEYLPGVFVGGVESPLSPLVYNACVHSDEVSLSGQYRPYCREADGYLLGEGCGMFTIEKYESAKKRNSSVLARIAGIGFGSSLSESIISCLQRAEKKPEEIDGVFLEAKGDPSLDSREMKELSKVFALCPGPILTTTQPLHGYLRDANLSIEFIAAIQALIQQEMPCGLFSENTPIEPDFGTLVVDKPMPAELENILVYATNDQGSSISVLLSRTKGDENV